MSEVTGPWWASRHRGNGPGAVGVAVFGVVTLVVCWYTEELDRVVPAWVALWLVVAGTLWVGLRRAPRWTLVLWPMLLSASVVVQTVPAPRAASLLIGVQTIGFLFIGLTQPPWRFLALLPVAGTVAWLSFDLAPADAAIRLGVAVIVWALVAEVPARLLQRLAEHRATLTALAGTDSLTGLANRSGMHAVLADVERGQRTGRSPSSLVLIDLDHFKAYNDSAGHLAGDQVLIDFAACLRAAVRGTDQAFRFGGEEFLLVLTQTSGQQAVDLVEQVRDAWRGHASGTTFSAGVAASLADADTQLYAAKAAGRDVTRGGSAGSR